VRIGISSILKFPNVSEKIRKDIGAPKGPGGPKRAQNEKKVNRRKTKGNWAQSLGRPKRAQKGPR